MKRAALVVALVALTLSAFNLLLTAQTPAHDDGAVMNGPPGPACRAQFTVSVSVEVCVSVEVPVAVPVIVSV